jgi:uncharacterized protein
MNELSLTQILIAFPIGILVSSIGTMVGIGGGIFMVPLLVIAFGLPLKEAIAAITFCLFPAALLSTFYNSKRKKIDYYAGISLEIPTIIGTILGTFLITLIPLVPMKIVFIFFLVYMSQRMLVKKTIGSDWVTKINLIPPVVKKPDYHVSLTGLSFFGLLSGVIAGLFGIGGGIIKTPVMIKIFKMPAHKATATALFMIVFTSFTASVFHWNNRNLNWNIALPLSLAFLIGSFIGNNLSNTFSARRIEVLLGVTILLAAIAISIHAYFLV